MSVVSISTLQDALPEPGPSLSVLIASLADAFACAADLYRALREREEGGWKEIERIKRLPHREERVIERIEIRPLDGAGREKRDSALGDADEESIHESAVLVRKELDHGTREVGQQYAVGDAQAHTQIQAEIIALQQITIDIYANFFGRYGKERPIAQHIAMLMSRVRNTRMRAVEALTNQYHRMYIPPPQIPAPVIHTRDLSPVLDPPRLHASSLRSASEDTQIVQVQRQRSVRGQVMRKESDMITTMSGPTSIISNVNRHNLFCLYAIDLQDHKSQPLADAFFPEGDGRCPYCSLYIRSSAGKSWEVFKDSDVRGKERKFHIDSRFVVKSHREGGGFACVLCSQRREADTVTEDILSLIDHVWVDHTAEEYAKEIDIKEVV
ncbi:hypothetical protein EJ05DRAFT_127937 [Pseudovirgaria hyperparasitica]|uniref:Uncharacterized protein n=1 Tax=Pseudovirgaria hyperparasitica TaxID=470096 RepID=A0A6A6W2L0_9PEZI|nr:uncharacterized protein EJ05DRAFT_127937 [Pseudovirgaria hyperparasitica]KAF2755261.1 hypothetical protein EJ05DRAFT_127937 [Pseudovirgaria hyperparasitica]